MKLNNLKRKDLTTTGCYLPRKLTKTTNSSIKLMLSKLLEEKKFSMTMTTDDNGLLTLTLDENPQATAATEKKKTPPNPPRVSLSPDLKKEHKESELEVVDLVNVDDDEEAADNVAAEDDDEDDVQQLAQRDPDYDSDSDEDFPLIEIVRRARRHKKKPPRAAARGSVATPATRDRTTTPANKTMTPAAASLQEEEEKVDEIVVEDLDDSELERDAKASLPTLFDLNSSVTNPADPAKAIGFLVENGVVPKPPTKCPKCDGPITYRSSKTNPGEHSLMRCRNIQCNALNGAWSQSMFKGTIVEGLKMPKATFITLVYLWLLEAKQDSVSAQTGLSQSVVSEWFSFFAETATLEVIGNFNKFRIGGPGVIVEIDKSKFSSKRKYNRGQKIEGCWVFGGVERLPKLDKDGNQIGWRAGKQFAVLCPKNKRDARTLLPLIRKHILPGSHIISDGWKAYKSIPKIRGGNYQHSVVVHKQHFKDPATGACTNTIEGARRSQYKCKLASRSYTSGLLGKHFYRRMWATVHKTNMWQAFWDALAGVDAKKDMVGARRPSKRA